MNGRKRWALALAFAVDVLFSAPAGAVLIDRGNGLVYDDVLDITWVQDAGLGSRGNWFEWMAWADALVFEGFSDWRLPSMDVNGDDMIVECDTASEIDCRDNELAFMYYYNLGGMIGDDLTGNQGLIQNIQPRWYWSSTLYPPITSGVWIFAFGDGANSVFDRVDRDIWGWAVRDGDVLAAPEPATLALLGIALAGLGFSRRRKLH